MWRICGQRGRSGWSNKDWVFAIAPHFLKKKNRLALRLILRARSVQNISRALNRYGWTVPYVWKGERDVPVSNLELVDPVGLKRDWLIPPTYGGANGRLVHPPRGERPLPMEW